MDGDSGVDRRTFVKAAGVAGAAAALGAQGGAAASAVSTRVLDRQFDADGGVQEALVVFDDAADAARLESLDLPRGYRVFEHVATAWTALSPDQLEAVAGWESVRRVKFAEELEWYNDTVSRDSMHVTAVQNGGEPGTATDTGETVEYDGPAYAGEGTHVVVIDSGIDAVHPGLRGRVEANYRWVDRPVGAREPLWVDAGTGDTDELGHGTHCAGIVAGNDRNGTGGGGGLQGDYTGMAPRATLTGYSTTGGVYLPYVVGAWNHVLGRAKADRDFDPDVVSNSYGVARGMPYNPNDPVNVASWRAFEMGILPVWAMGNDGPETGTGNRFAKAPHVLGVAAAEKTVDTEDPTNDRPVADFSSRGRELSPDAVEYDREATLDNLREFHAIQSGEHRTAERTTISGRFGPGVNSSPAASGVDEEVGVAYEHIETYGNVDLVDLTLSVTPRGQWVRVTVYDEAGDRVAMMGEEPVHQHRTLTFAVDGGETYTVELEPEGTTGAEYTLDVVQQQKAGALSSVGPVTLFRPGIATHGVAVMSTIDKYDALGPLGPAYGGSGTEPFYARISGTSMACPGAAGIAALVIQAYADGASGGDDGGNGEDADGPGERPAPIDVVRVLESTAAEYNPNYAPANAGAGFADAAAAVETARKLGAGELSREDLETGTAAVLGQGGSDDGAGGGEDDGDDRRGGRREENPGGSGEVRRPSEARRARRRDPGGRAG